MSVSPEIIPPAILATPLAPSPAAKFYRSSPPRPILARDADSLYWMARYVERAEHAARLLMISANVLTDVGDVAPDLQRRQWQSILKIMHLPDVPADGSADSIANRVSRYMALDLDNPNSIVTVLSRARENARGIRENISAEMWEHLNTLYWSIRSDESRNLYDESPDDFYRQVMSGSMLFQGLTDQTLAHDQRWHFTQLGKYFERIDVTCRVIETKFNILRSVESALEPAVRNIHWMAVLRSCCSIEAYRQNHLGDMDPLRVASFLILESDFPRSIRFSVKKAHEAIARVRADIDQRSIDPAERILGRLAAQLEYAEMPEILTEGLPAYLQKIQTGISEAALEVQKTYFLH